MLSGLYMLEYGMGVKNGRGRRPEDQGFVKGLGLHRVSGLGPDVNDFRSSNICACFYELHRSIYYIPVVKKLHRCRVPTHRQVDLGNRLFW